MSSHREAPEISKDPVADSTDLYAFVSPDVPDMVTLIANYIPLEHPDGGPNFYEFGDDVVYAINIDNNGDGRPEIVYEFRFSTVNTNPNTFLYNTGPITSLTSPNWNRRQTYTLSRWDGEGRTQLGSGIPCPPCNIGPISTSNYSGLAAAAQHQFHVGRYSGQVFAGQRAEGFYVDLGAVFDLAILRPFAADHATFGFPVLQNMPGVNSTQSSNVHSLALQVPISQLTGNRSTPTSVTDPHAVIGVWTSASRRKVSITEHDRYGRTHSGPYVQVSRLGNPLVNEVIIALGEKDRWNALPPVDEHRFIARYTNPELAQLLPVLYPGVFPNLAAYNSGSPNRADLVAILLTGIPNGVVPGVTFSTYNGTGVQADQLRLNVAIPPTPMSSVKNLGLLGGDIGGFPNGRRVFDDVATIELRAIAGATLPLVDPAFTADAATGEVSFGLTSSTNPGDTTAKGTENYLSSFPYLGLPISGYDVMPAAVSTV
jgi:Domain of unknown function (DUF4331)